MKTKKDIDAAILAATGVAREIDDVRAKRQRFHDDPMLAAMTRSVTAAIVQTLADCTQTEPAFRESAPAERQALAAALLESGANERKAARYRSASGVYNALAAAEALLNLVRREYALSESLLALTTALNSPATHATISSSLKMNDAALSSLEMLCDGMRGGSGTHTDPASGSGAGDE
jgi:hypothetical protein